jgi:Predicted redox protein, regulator of disulfide bond formation
MIPRTSIDLRGIRCPLTTIRLKRAIKELPPGTMVEVTTDDIEAKTDIPALLKTAGHVLVQHTLKGNHEVYEIRLKNESAGV